LKVNLLQKFSPRFARSEISIFSSIHFVYLLFSSLFVKSQNFLRASREVRSKNFLRALREVKSQDFPFFISFLYLMSSLFVELEKFLRASREVKSRYFLRASREVKSQKFEKITFFGFHGKIQNPHGPAHTHPQDNFFP
jgi:hypothetical protein